MEGMCLCKEQWPQRTFLFPQVGNTSLELLPLWLVSGSYAYSFEAACPLGKTYGCL